MMINSIKNFTLSSLTFFKEQSSLALTQGEKKVALIAFAVIAGISLFFVFLSQLNHSLMNSDLEKAKRFVFDANDYYEQNNFRAAAALYQRIVKRDPEDVFALSHLGECLRMQNKLTEAAAQFQKALELSPTDIFSLKGYAETLREQGKFAEAAAEFQKVMDLKSFAETLRDQGKLTEDSIEFKKALQSAPDEFTLTHYAETLRQLGKYEEAEKCRTRTRLNRFMLEL